MNVENSDFPYDCLHILSSVFRLEHFLNYFSKLAQIGDPSGKSSERPAMSLDEISQNVSGLKKNLETVFSNHENFIWNESKTNKDAKLKPVAILNNQDWYKSINLVQFLREYGRHFRYLFVINL